MDDVLPRYLVLVGGGISDEYEDESKALASAERMLKETLVRRVEVVRSVRRWELDDATGEMLEVGEKLKDQTYTMGYADGHEPWGWLKKGQPA